MGRVPRPGPPPAVPHRRILREPGFNRSFVSVGREGYPLKFPATIDPRINGTSSVIAALDFRDGRAFVDGQGVTLPYEWTRTGANDWRAVFRITHGPQDVRTFTMGSCI